VDKIGEYLKKIIKKANDTQAYYTYTIDHRSTLDKPLYNITVIWTKQGLAPLQMSANSKKELLESLKKYYRTQKHDALQIQFHKNQIEASKNVIKYHEKMILSYTEPTEEKKK
jgi:peptidyl-tRNA hydrolase